LAALAVLAAGVLGGHVAEGGFLSDDFTNAAKASAGSGLASARRPSRTWRSPSPSP
jgi:hypothetical protein